MASINNEPVKYDTLSKTQRLAIFMIVIGERAASDILKAFDDFELEQVCTEMANIHIIDEDLAQQVLGALQAFGQQDEPDPAGERRDDAAADARLAMAGRVEPARLGAGPGVLILEAMAQATGLPEALCRCLAARGVNPGDAAAYLEPTLREMLPDPLTLRDMGKAADRLIAALRRRERIAVFADYDVDGGASAALPCISTPGS